MSGRIDIEDIDSSDCMLCMECVKKTESMGMQNVIDVSIIPHQFVFTVESTGALSPEQIVINAMKIIHSKISTLSQHVHTDGLIINR
jgi:DNA-directed RNA polymerase II subunit RPB3